MATTDQAGGALPSGPIPRGEVGSKSEMNEEFATHPDTFHEGATAAARLEVEDEKPSQAGPPAPRAGPAVIVPSSGRLNQVADTLHACVTIPEAPAPAVDDDFDDDDTDKVDVDEEEEEEEVSRWNVWDENREAWTELRVPIKPSPRAIREGLPVRRMLSRAAKGKQAEAPPVDVNTIKAINTIEANEKGKKKAVAEDTSAVDEDNIKATARRKIIAKGKGREEPPTVHVDSGAAEEQPKIVSKADKSKSKASKHTSEAVKVAIRAAKKVSQMKAVEHSISPRRRKEPVKTTIRAKKVTQVKAAGRKVSTRGRGAAKAAVTGATSVTGRVSLVLLPPKKASKVKITVEERPPLSGAATHNTPSKSSVPKIDEGGESISSRSRLTIKLPAMNAVEHKDKHKDEAADKDTKENPSAVVTMNGKEVDIKALRRSTRNAEKPEVPKANEVGGKRAAGRPKRKKIDEDVREGRDGAKRTKKDDAKPAEEEPKPRIVLRIPKGPTPEDTATVKAEVVEGSKGQQGVIPETIENDKSKLRRSARPKKASFKTRYRRLVEWM
ncbi:hypothetical protein PLEOSDRAFT_168647 [Pleurotus ostreatus PC15]|uniref:Uncharacterized protein n=1 Tax=Pleurotus ostreatus (strain PC15) TaxID=1137138 RepID=A0A067NU27_PLEO1|nr:hypothetical protein PLEOSDRAFT_168647 [Pleurotus ostreatus PC15]